MTREEHADYVRWLKKPAAQKGPFPYALSRMFRNAKQSKDPSFSVHITREGGMGEMLSL